MNLYDDLIQYSKENYYPFHMPGHKRQKFLEEMSPYHYDITEIDGFDNLHDASGILMEEMKKAAKIYHASETYYLVNGSTSGLLTAISAAVKPGEHILVARNCHKSVYHAISLRNLIPHYVYPKMLSEYNMAGGIDPEDVRTILKQNPQIKAVIITSPTYDGILSDVQEISKIVHEQDGILIVDEAHGAHLSFHPEFPKSAVCCDADLVIQSVHKTLPSLTQTALLHRVTQRVPKELIEKFLAVYQTSSPSYVLMASIARCMEFVKTGSALFEQYKKMLDQFYIQVEELKHLVVLKDLKGEAAVYQKDPSKIVILVRTEQVSGAWLYEQLLKKYHIQAEMAAKDYVICLSSVCDKKEGFDRLSEALHKIDDSISFKLLPFHGEEHIYSHQVQNFIENEMVVTPYEADLQEAEVVDLSKAMQRISKDYIYLYPPGIPIITPGERISKELIFRIKQYQEAGLTVHGLAEKNGMQVRVMK